MTKAARSSAVGGIKRPYTGRRGLTVGDRLEFYSMPTTDCGCSLWLGCLNKNGYGQLRLNGRMVYAHRLSWENKNGPIPDGLFALHHCDNPACINPDHLFLGSHKDNSDDKVKKKRHRWNPSPPLGADNLNAKLTDSDVAKIRASNATQRKIAADFGIAQVTVSKIINRKQWGHI